MLGGKRQPVRPVEKLTSAVARNFSGGLNTFDPPLNLSSKFITTGRNVYPDPNGVLRVRFGTSLFSDLSGVGDRIVAMEYYYTALICVFADGRVAAVDADGTATQIFDTAIAAALSGAPAAWSPCEFASFAQFAGELIICNGIDKPLIVDNTLSVQYLADLGSGSNVNTPRAKYVVTHNNYLVMAVTPDDTTTLYISSKGTSGTFAGDPIPNDGVNFETATYMTRGIAEITGLGSFRDKLIVTYGENIIPVALGEYVSTDHVPRVDDVIEAYGSISHKCIVPMGDDILFLDKVGISSVQRALITATMSPTRESLLVSRELQQALKLFTAAELQNYVWAIHDRIAQQVLFFIPSDSAVTADALVYTMAPNTAPTNTALSEGDLRVTSVVGASRGINTCAVGKTTGKYFFQITTGILPTDFYAGICTGSATPANILANGLNAVLFNGIGEIDAEGVDLTNSIASMTSARVVSVAIDLTARKAWFKSHKLNGQLTAGSGTATEWNGDASHDPDTGAGGITIPAWVGESVYPFVMLRNGTAGDTVKFNFGSSPWVGMTEPDGFKAYGAPRDTFGGQGWNAASGEATTRFVDDDFMVRGDTPGVVDWVTTSAALGTGKYYWQVRVDDIGFNSAVGIVNPSDTTKNVTIAATVGDFQRNSVSIDTTGGYTTGVFEFAVDTSADLFWFRRCSLDGVAAIDWNDTVGADPATGVSGVNIATVTGARHPCVRLALNDNGSDIYLNVGQLPWAGSLTPPTGFTVLGTGTPVASDDPAPAEYVEATANNDVYVFCVDKSQKFRAMAKFSDMPYRCAARTGDGRIFVGTGVTLYYYRNQYEPLYSDQAVTGTQPWDDELPWDDAIGWVGEGVEETFVGAPIYFDIQTPWSDMKEPDKQKDSRYLHCMMDGAGTVGIEMYTDRFAETQLSMTFTMTDYPATNLSTIRPLNNDQLYAWNTKFTRARLRVVGYTTQALALISLGVLYLPGGYRR